MLEHNDDGDGDYDDKDDDDDDDGYSYDDVLGLYGDAHGNIVGSKQLNVIRYVTILNPRCATGRQSGLAAPMPHTTSLSPRAVGTIQVRDPAIQDGMNTPDEVKETDAGGFGTVAIRPAAP